MRYVVHVEVPVELGNRMEKEGDPFQKLAPLLERFKPQAVYLGMAKRELFLVVNLDQPFDLGELTVSIAQMMGVYPTVHPVLALEDMQTLDPTEMNAMMERVRQFAQ